MSHKERHGIIRWVVILPVLSLLFTILLFTKIFLNYGKSLSREESYARKAETIKQAKQDAMRRVNDFARYIQISSRILSENSEQQNETLDRLAYGYVESMNQERCHVFVYEHNGSVVFREKNEFNGIDNRTRSLLVKSFIYGARVLPEGYFRRYEVNSEGAEKVVYIRGIPELGWIVGVGVYHDDLMRRVEKREDQLRAQFSKVTREFGYLALLLSLYLMLAMFLIFAKLKKRLDQHQSDLVEKSTQIEKQKEQLEQQLEQDHLTKLPNRMLLYTTLKRMIRHARSESEHVAVLFVDVDNFKEINDTMGHDTGDMVLKVVADRFRKITSETHFAARFAGDEFILLVDRCKNREAVATVLARVAELFSEPITIEGRQYHIALSIGISLFPEDGNDMITLLKNADIAMYKSKLSGGGRHSFFSKTSL